MKLTDKRARYISIFCQTIILICSLVTLVITHNNFIKVTSILVFALSIYFLYLDIRQNKR